LINVQDSWKHKDPT